jgi:3',5'-cyclic AMP phosphodiesterase CpdA
LAHLEDLMSDSSRRDLLRLAGGALWVGAAAACGSTAAGAAPTTPSTPAVTPSTGFLMFQLTDTHWGYKGPANPTPTAAFERAVAEIARWPHRPELVVHTGDVTHMTTDAGERTARLQAAKALLGQLGTELLVIPGEHDAAADRGAAFQAVFGATHQAREHKGVAMIALDNTSDPKGALGDEQLAWLDREVGKVAADRPLLVFVHRPLFPLAQAWDWYTPDGDRALAILDRHPRTTVFYGHIHQAHVKKTNAILHVATRSLVFPLPAPGSQPAKAPLPFDADAVDHGLGYRGIAMASGELTSLERALVG